MCPAGWAVAGAGYDAWVRPLAWITLGALAGVGGCGGGLQFSPAVERAWRLQCPESRISVLSRREFGPSHVYELDACGELVEIEDRPRFDPPVTMGAAEMAALRAELEPGADPRLGGAATGPARHWCEQQALTRVRLPSGEEPTPAERREEFQGCRRSVEANLVTLGSSREHGERRAYFRMDTVVLTGWLELGQPSCPHLRHRRCMNL
jgi:hypothetical protein